MFVCKECAKNYDVQVPLEILEITVSYGTCEDCKIITGCYDLPHNSYRLKAAKSSP